jgi:hypothetical protein
MSPIVAAILEKAAEGELKKEVLVAEPNESSSGAGLDDHLARIGERVRRSC